MDLLLIVFLTLLNGLFAMSELAVASSRKARLAAMAESGDAGAAAPAGRPAALLVAIAIAAVEALAVLAYAAGIALSGFANPDSVAAPGVEVVIYVIFAVGIGVRTLVETGAVLFG